jgi:hypothetical protein
MVVEDEALIAFEIESALEALGREVVGPVSALETALQLARESMLDAAVLEVTVRGGKIYPVAEHLVARHIPFVLASGYRDWVSRICSKTAPASPNLSRHPSWKNSQDFLASKSRSVGVRFSKLDLSLRRLRFRAGSKGASRCCSAVVA